MLINKRIYLLLLVLITSTLMADPIAPLTGVPAAPSVASLVAPLAAIPAVPLTTVSSAPSAVAHVTPASISAHNIKVGNDIEPGIKYKKFTTDNQQIIHILDVDPKLIEIRLVRAKNFRRSRESVKDIAENYNALAAINGGFFRVDKNGNGIPAGLLKIQNDLHGIAYNERATIGWDNKQDIVLIDKIQTKTTLINGKHTLSLHGMNIPLTNNRAILYSNEYDNNQLNFQEPAQHFIICNNKIVDMQLQNNLTIPPTISASSTPSTCYVYSVGLAIANGLPTLSTSEEIIINTKFIPSFSPEASNTWDKLPFILSGAPLLLKDGKLIKDYTKEKLSDNFINNKYARTAIGILANGHWIFVVADGDPIIKATAGLSIHELALTMKKLGCINALNLDGGTSSTMYFNHKVVSNSNSETNIKFTLSTSRKVTDAIILLKK